MNPDEHLCLYKKHDKGRNGAERPHTREGDSMTTIHTQTHGFQKQSIVGCLVDCTFIEHPCRGARFTPRDVDWRRHDPLYHVAVAVVAAKANRVWLCSVRHSVVFCHHHRAYHATRLSHVQCRTREVSGRLIRKLVRAQTPSCNIVAQNRRNGGVR